MRSRWLILVVALALGLAAAGLTSMYLSGVRTQVLKAAKPVKVLVANEDIPKGTTVEAIMERKLIEQRDVPQQFVTAEAISSLRTVDGQVLAVSVSRGEQLSKTRFQFSSQAGLSFGIPKGYVGLTIPSDDSRGVAGLIKPGDNVVIWTSVKQDANDENSWVTKPCVTGASVIAVRKSTGVEADTDTKRQGGSVLAAQKTDSSEGPPTVTLALKPAEAQSVVLAEEVGRVWLSLLPTDAKSTPGRAGITRVNLVK